MHGFGQTISESVVATVLLVFGVLLSMLSLSENNQQQSANTIVQTALLDASDNNGKVVDGTMVINTKRFEKNLQQSNIANWRKKSRGSKNGQAEVALGVYYLDDQSKNATDFHKLENPKNPDNKAIKGVKVVIMRLIKSTPSEAAKKLAADQKSNNKQLGVADSEKQVIDNDQLDKLPSNSTVYLVQPTDIITYLISGHGQLRNDDTAVGFPKLKPDANNRDTTSDGYLGGYTR